VLHETNFPRFLTKDIATVATSKFTSKGGYCKVKVDLQCGAAYTMHFFFATFGVPTTNCGSELIFFVNVMKASSTLVGVLAEVSM
jgi:hypothetical protein